MAGTDNSLLPAAPGVRCGCTPLTVTLLPRVLGCQEGRSAARWQDYSLFGHQLVCHLVPGYNAAASHNAVDGDPVPVPHFGLALAVQQFHDFAAHLQQHGVNFVIEPHLRFKGAPLAAQLALNCARGW